MLIADVEHDARQRVGRSLIQIEEEAEREADRKARNILSIAMGRLAGSHASETTTRMVELPSEEMKGRIIGREGRNIRALEALTGVDIIIDETPNAVVLSSFDGNRREIARLTLERLIADGRIQPVAIEEVYSKAKEDVEATIVAEGERAELEVGGSRDRPGAARRPRPPPLPHLLRAERPRSPDRGLQDRRIDRG